MKKTIIIQGSSRSNGNTSKIINHIALKNKYDIIDLSVKNIGHFNYDFKNKNDDFLPLIKEVIETYDTIIFATPVYWYTMSGILKVFFDRFSDLLHFKKELGRKLRGKNMAMISCGSGPELKETFAIPFIESANYLGMQYLGDVHTWINDDTISDEVLKKINAFVLKINTFE